MTPTSVPLLIVDDDPVFSRLVRQLVLSLGGEFPCAPQCVGSAEDALTELGHNHYEVVLLDYNLPNADGLKLLAQIREFPSAEQPAVIMLTASGNEAVAVEAMKRGAKDYLTKADLDVSPLARAVHNALSQKRLADQVARYNAERQAELDMARQLQHSLLPDRYPHFPRIAAPADSALRFTHRFCPAAELAGDFFSVVALSDTEAGVFICDVMGHGVRSALVTAMLRAFMDDLAPRGTDPAWFLAEMNRKLCALIQPSADPVFATAFYLIADVGRGQLRFANAGHPRPLHLRRRAGVAAPLPRPERPGPALGLIADATYTTGQLPLAPDDLVLLFTDGLFEVVAADGQEDFGQQRLLITADKHMKLPPAELLDAILAEVRQFSGGAEFTDDVCLLALEVAQIVLPVA